MGLKGDFKAEFLKSNLLFANCEPHLMYTSKHCCVVTIPLLIFRVIAALLTASVTCISLLKPNETLNTSKLAFFTIWSYLLITIYFMLSAIISIAHFCIERRRSPSQENQHMATIEQGQFLGERPKTDVVTVAPVGQKRGPEPTQELLPWYMKIQWLLYNIALPNAFLVTMVYWAVLYPLLRSTNFQTNVIDIAVHGFNSVLMIIEQYLGSVPTRLLHVYQPLLYGAVYAIFSVVFWKVTGKVLYPYVLDWTYPGYTVGSLCGIVLYTIVAQLVLFLIYNLRQRYQRNSVVMTSNESLHQ